MSSEFDDGIVFALGRLLDLDVFRLEPSVIELECLLPRLGASDIWNALLFALLPYESIEEGDEAL